MLISIFMLIPAFLWAQAPPAKWYTHLQIEKKYTKTKATDLPAGRHMPADPSKYRWELVNDPRQGLVEGSLPVFNRSGITKDLIFARYVPDKTEIAVEMIGAGRGRSNTIYGVRLVEDGEDGPVYWVSAVFVKNMGAKEAGPT